MRYAIALMIIGLVGQWSFGEIAVGSKKFTESVVLGELVRQALGDKGISATHIAELGGTRILWSALLSGNIHVYPEYTGTIEEELLKRKFGTFEDLQEALAQEGLGMTNPLGFNNTYAVGMKRKRATELGIRKISDLARFPQIKFGWASEFLNRRDGWPGLRDKYQLPHVSVRGMDHDVAYRALESGDIDVTDLYSTDAEIEYYDLAILQDDRGYFPKYEAVFLYRLDSAKNHPKMLETLNQFSGKIPEAQMIRMNRQAKIDKIASSEVAGQFLKNQFGIKVSNQGSGIFARLLETTRDHLKLVLLSLFVAIFAAIPLGVLAAKYNLIGELILWTVGGIQTVPSLALLVVLIRPLNLIGLTGIGDTPALIALFLYSLLPIVRGTHIGFQQIPLELRETEEVLALSRFTRLFRIEFPLALPSILSGIKTAAVMNVGFATLGALVGAGGYGQPILTGIRLDDYSLILEGAIPSAVLALLTQALFNVVEKLSVSRGVMK